MSERENERDSEEH